MGCDTYYIGKTTVSFSENYKEFGCLCTFPHNYKTGKRSGELDNDVLRSLALLGAVVVLIHHNDSFGPVYIPNNIPKWIIEEIERLLPLEEPNYTCDDVFNRELNKWKASVKLKENND